ncbi:hypothetical protein [Yersinia enterocolitica]|uniref:hypothetical protein n=1 Tax=Yersinia enterocolitica TaxID=630 RepID=UPI001C60C916|nr:hypothetical protein [Yersinia enterocolitica]MBW5848162.1 hypothetical protein [Yersinia enterocolitica]MBW5865231.1 hypothetical protein [Yersinia enterocolitica]HDY4924799.1 hypothetical protein [Yersinia enterocolitica]HDY4932883.1 hypothetical protein [Yersinia enterocolitica]
MDDKSIEMLLSEKKFISKRDIEFIRKQAIGNNSTFDVVIGKLKKLFLVMTLLKVLFLLIGLAIFILGDFLDFISYSVALTFGLIVMYFIAPMLLGAKLLFVSLKE